MAVETKLSPLETEIRQRIASIGPMPVAQYMALCLTHPKYGYYMTRDPFGAAGDFTTAPEVSQMFGELLGLWAAAVWTQMGSPEDVRLIELGPGRGTMMQDALRAIHATPAFRKALVVHFVEISPSLEKLQRQAFANADVPVNWHASLDEVPEGRAIILANEFFDALPVQQAIMCADGWHERVVRIGNNERLEFSNARDPIPLFDPMVPEHIDRVKIGEIFEWRSDHLALELGRRVVRSEGAALVIDYGHVESAMGETLQAVRGHAFADPCDNPGESDLTAHVDFRALAHAGETMDARIHGPIGQGLLLRRLGIASRAANLKKFAPADKAAAINAALARLAGDGRNSMGRLFKAIGFSHEKLGPLPGFES